MKKLEDKLKQNPGDSKGWVMLARSYKGDGAIRRVGGCL